MVAVAIIVAITMEEVEAVVLAEENLRAEVRLSEETIADQKEEAKIDRKAEAKNQAEKENSLMQNQPTKPLKRQKAEEPEKVNLTVKFLKN